MMRNFERKFPRIKSAKQLKPILTRAFPQHGFPMGTQIILDKKRDAATKNHQLIWKSGAEFGSAADICEHISHEELFELAEKGFIELIYV